jgi:hypothetical protein
MNDPGETLLSRAVRAQRAALNQIEPSAELDARFERSVQAWRTERARSGRWRRWSWMMAAAATVALVAGASWLVMGAGTHREDPVVENPGFPRVAPGEPAVLRVQGSLGTPIPVWAGNGLPPHRRQYWIDVGIGTDGSLYIERVTPVDESGEL